MRSGVKKYMALANLFGGQFHNSWPEEYGTREAAIEDYCKRSSMSWLKKVLGEIEDLIEAKYDENTLRRIVYHDCHANFRPIAVGLTYQQWLEKVFQMIVMGVKNVCHQKSTL